MELPKTFKPTIAKVFYDKTISILGETVTTEADGAVNKVHDTVTGTFKGNARLTNFKLVQEEYGLDHEIDIAITCATTVSISTGDLIEYGGVRYEVTDVLPRDSHQMIVGNKWHNQA